MTQAIEMSAETSPGHVVWCTYSVAIGKSADAMSFLTSVEGLALLFACVAVVVIPAGGIYADKNAEKTKAEDACGPGFRRR
jgi:hypothetical protein